MTFAQILPERRGAARARPSWWFSLGQHRLAFALLALVHAMVCRLIEQHVLFDTGLFTYMGLRWFYAPVAQEIGFLFLAVMPALTFLPYRLSRSSDLLLITFYGTVFVPATALFPNVATGNMGSALAFTAASLAGLYLATVLSRMTVAAPRGGFLSETGYDVTLYAVAILVMISYLAFVPIQVLDLNLAHIYEYRDSFFDKRSEISPILLYAFVNSALALSPLMIVRGMTKGNYFMVGLAVILTSYTFVVTSFRIFLFVPILAAALTYILRSRLAAGIGIFATFVGIAGATVLIDLITRTPVPVATFSMHYRLFGNSAVINAAYLDFFSQEAKFFYSQSFLNFAISPPIDTPYPLLIGQIISPGYGVWANGNMAADAFANLGYLGVLLIYGLLGLFLALYNNIAQGKDLKVTALALVASGFSLSNGGLQSAVLSGGLGVTLLLIFWYPRPLPPGGAGRGPAVRRPRSPPGLTGPGLSGRRRARSSVAGPLVDADTETLDPQVEHDQAE